jgi:hypothetical protein
MSYGNDGCGSKTANLGAGGRRHPARDPNNAHSGIRTLPPGGMESERESTTLGFLSTECTDQRGPRTSSSHPGDSPDAVRPAGLLRPAAAVGARNTGSDIGTIPRTG